MQYFRDRNSPIQAGFNFSLVLTPNGVISAGKNNVFQLGRVKTSEKDIGFIEIPGEKIIMISAHHSYHCLLYTNLKRVYKTNDMGKKCLERIKFFDGKDVIAMKTKSRSSYVVTKEGIFSFGINDYNVLCHSDYDFNHSREKKLPQKIKFPKNKKIVSFSCGWGHVMSCFNDGTCYGCGCNTNGNLGLGHLDSVYELTEVKYFRKNHIFIVQVSCGYAHNTAYLSDMGHCFVSGQAKYTGFRNNKKIPTEHKSLRNKRIVKVIAGSNCTSFLSKENEIYFVGSLVFLKEKKIYYTPVKFITENKMVDCKCGGEYGLGFHLFYDIFNKVYSCGNNKNGECLSSIDKDFIEDINNTQNRSIYVVTIINKEVKAFRNKVMKNRNYRDIKIVNTKT